MKVKALEVGCIFRKTPRAIVTVSFNAHRPIVYFYYFFTPIY